MVEDLLVALCWGVLEVVGHLDGVVDLLDVVGDPLQVVAGELRLLVGLMEGRVMVVDRLVWVVEGCHLQVARMGDRGVVVHREEGH